MSDRPWRCRWFHMRSGVALIAMDERGRRWCVWEWECECGRKYSEGFLVEQDDRRFPKIGALIADAIVD